MYKGYIAMSADIKHLDFPKISVLCLLTTRIVFVAQLEWSNELQLIRQIDTTSIVN